MTLALYRRLDGFSKAYAMTGWRIGYVAAPAHILEAMLKIHQYTVMCAGTASQEAAIEALRNGENDVQMLAWAGMGVAMSHGSQTAIKAAKLVSPKGPPETAFARAVDVFESNRSAARISIKRRIV